MRKRTRILTKGDVVKSHRIAAGYPHAKDVYPAMAEMGISASVYQVMEQGKLATRENIEIVARFFGADPEDLIDNRLNTSIQQTPDVSLYGVFASNLARYMRHKDISANSIAHRAGMNPRTVWSIQNAETKASLDSLYAICATLGVDLLLMLIPNVPLDALDHSRRYRRSLEGLIQLDENDAVIIQGMLAWFGAPRRDDQMLVSALTNTEHELTITTKHRSEPSTDEIDTDITREADQRFAEATNELELAEAALRESMAALETAVSQKNDDRISAAKLEIEAKSERVHKARQRVNSTKKNRKVIYDAEARRLRTA